jgi:Uma2 family endonuclease
MSAIAKPEAVHYPDSDGQPMADNTVQFDWIAVLKWNAEIQYRDDPDVFVAGDHLIYPVEGRADVRQAPDVYVAFGRPKGDRGSYRVWEEGGVFPQVVFEIWSPSNTPQGMRAKLEFYQRYGAEEYYLVYPEFPAFVEGWRRDGAALARIDEMNGHVSPRLGWRFELLAGELTVLDPHGRPLRRPDEIAAGLTAERDAAAAERDAAAAERDAARAEAARLADERDAERERAARLAARLRELGIDPDAG